jgi:hypothetical protein
MSWHHMTTEPSRVDLKRPCAGRQKLFRSAIDIFAIAIIPEVLLILLFQTIASNHTAHLSSSRFDEADSRGVFTHSKLLFFPRLSQKQNRASPLPTVPRSSSSGTHVPGCLLASSSACTLPVELTSLEPLSTVSQQCLVCLVLVCCSGLCRCNRAVWRG